MIEFRVLGKKGEGTFSEVLKCQNIKDGSYWACKKMKQHYESLDQVNNLREIQAMRRLSPHPNILELEEVIFDKRSGTLVLICELMDMNIYELIRGKRHYLPERTVKNYMYQLCKSVDHMHRNGIFHRDVKPENILIREDVLKLADFGSCRSVYSKQPYTEYISTRWYRAPECLLTDGYYGYKMDMWSVGCVFFEILSLHPLFPGSNEVDQIAKIHDIVGTPEPGVLNKLRNKARGMNFNFPSKKGTGMERLLPHAPKEAIELIYKLCAYDPEERLSAKQSLRHPYFKEYRDADRRAAAANKAQKENEIKNLQIKNETNNAKNAAAKEEKMEIVRPRVELSKHGPPAEITPLIFPKAQSLPAQIQPFRKRKKKRYEHNFGTGLSLPRVPNHGSSLASTYHHAPTFSTTFKYRPSASTFLPSIHSYKPKKAPNQSSKHLFGQYQFSMLAKRGSDF
ncbi:MAPK/MAK/MRK overlapping kinase-like [Liolophura sinensis]|uniref:MAPK/MAK/MRK overlapping kinase-like n=1 Tax=Liolophura sinensis TaxID=3198878 RepID=UPI00315833CC